MRKKKMLLFVFCVLCLTAALLCGCAPTLKKSDYIRLHIRADSNSDVAQEVKLEVRDELVAYLTVQSENVSSKEEMYSLLQNQLPKLEQIANGVLSNQGFDYTSSAHLGVEEFPEKSYGDLTLKAGEYTALIIELGSGKGDNWWCVAYPPLCFIATEDTKTEGVEYKSIIADFFASLEK